MSKKDGSIVLGLICLSIIAAGVIGWVLNIAALVHTSSDPITGFFILRCVGIFVSPLGSILGYF